MLNTMSNPIRGTLNTILIPCLSFISSDIIVGGTIRRTLCVTNQLLLLMKNVGSHTIYFNTFFQILNSLLYSSKFIKNNLCVNLTSITIDISSKLCFLFKWSRDQILTYPWFLWELFCMNVIIIRIISYECHNYKNKHNCVNLTF